MVESNFYILLKTFLEEFPRPDKEVISTEFRIEIQPGFVSFSGDFILIDNDSSSVDLRQIGKLKCSRLTDQIEEFHSTTTKNGENKWNKAFIAFSKAGQIRADFTWDEEFEKENINGYRELDRQRWYWEEK